MRALPVLERHQHDIGGDRRTAERLLADRVRDRIHHRSITGADRRLADATGADRRFRIGDVGTIMNPRGLKGQLFGGSMLGLGHAQTQRWAYDQQYGVALARRFYQNKPPTILDAPHNFTGDAVNLPDPETPTGIRGVGEPPVGAAYGAIMCAIADAIGDEIFRRSPVSADIILTALENGGKRTHDVLTAHI